ncbi:hypothetical protein SDC9_182386 [bioreactor metagenome]|uniref:Uncharacterized protein n=1 Tax=bioreactor metagenome TaxID=1076179 RepID=A0A645H954_9ZZZZ
MPDDTILLLPQKPFYGQGGKNPLPKESQGQPKLPLCPKTLSPIRPVPLFHRGAARHGYFHFVFAVPCIPPPLILNLYNLNGSFCGNLRMQLNGCRSFPNHFNRVADRNLLFINILLRLLHNCISNFFICNRTE